MLNCTLQYPGKIPEEEILSQEVIGQLELDPSSAPQADNIFCFGDNFAILQHLRSEYASKIDLIYIDPPFGTGQAFSNIDQEIAYQDPFPDYHFLAFIRKRLILMRELLSPNGSIYLHIDKKIGHYIKLIMDEVFGQENFLNDISRIKCNPKNFARKAYGNFSDMILLYAKVRDQHIWNEIREPLSEEEIKRLFPKQHAEKGPYTTHPLHAPGETLQGDTGQEWKGMKPPKGRHWRYNRKVLDQLDKSGLIEWSSTGNPRKQVFAVDHQGKKIQDVWEFKDKGLSLVSYPTEKNHDMLTRIIQHSSHPNSYVLDAFAGSGSSLLLAHKLNRNWIGIDESEQSRQVIREKLKNQQIPYKYLIYTQP